jgi:hypothetical protein
VAHLLPRGVCFDGAGGVFLDHHDDGRKGLVLQPPCGSVSRDGPHCVVPHVGGDSCGWGQVSHGMLKRPLLPSNHGMLK